MSIYLWSSEPSKIYVWSNEVSAVFVGTEKVRPSWRLPSAYQEVEYIQSSGTQYINTWYIPNNTTKIEWKISNWNTSIWRYETFFWARLNWSSTGRWFLLDYDNNTWKYNLMFWMAYSWLSYNLPFSFANWNTHIIQMSSDWVYEDWTLKYSPASQTFTSPVNLYLFANNNNWSTAEQSWFKLHYFKIWNSWTLVRDFVPCYRKSDNVIWLYDLVNSAFYTNAWTGTFSKWWNVN
jgi:hypothetical protein